MGFFDFLKKKEDPTGEGPEEEPVTERVSYRDLDERVRELTSEGLEKEKKELASIHKRLEGQLEKIRELNRFLEAKSFEKQDRMFAAVNSIKDNYVKKSYSLIGSVPDVRGYGYDEIVPFSKQVTNVINQLKKTDPRQSVLLSRYFKHETGQIIRTLKEAGEALEEMKRVMGKGSLVMFEKRFRDKTKEIEDLGSQIRMEREESAHVKNKISEIEKNVREKKEELERFLKSPVYSRMIGLEGDIREAEERKDTKESIIRESLSEIKRPMKKIEYYLKQEGVPREVAESFDRFVHSPTKTFLSEGGDSLLKKVLDKTEELVSSGKVSLKDTDRDHLSEILEKSKQGIFGEHKKEYGEIVRELEDLRKETESSPVSEEKQKKEIGIKSLEKSLEERKRVLEDHGRSMEILEREIKSRKKELEKLILESLNRKIEIEF